jgi:hypothetical protein
MLDQLSADGRRIVVTAPDRTRVYLSVVALLLNPAEVNLPSGGRSTMCAEPTDDLLAAAERNRLTLIGEGSAPSGFQRVAVFELPSGDIDRHGMPAGSRIGLLQGEFFSAHAFFYPPMNLLEDVQAHFESLDLQQSDAGIKCGGGFEVTSQRYSAPLAEGALQVGVPEGSPSVSYEQTEAGKLWIEEDKGLVLESSDLRLTLAPWPSEPASQDRSVSPDMADLVRSISSATWR